MRLGEAVETARYSSPQPVNRTKAAVLMRASISQLKPRQLPAAGQALADVKLAIGAGRMVPGLAADLNTAQFGVLVARRFDHDELAAISHHQQPVAPQNGRSIILAEPLLRPHELARQRVNANEVVSRPLAEKAIP